MASGWWRAAALRGTQQAAHIPRTPTSSLGRVPAPSSACGVLVCQLATFLPKNVKNQSGMLSKMEVMGTKIQPQPLLHRPIGMEYMLAGDSELESHVWQPHPGPRAAELHPESTKCEKLKTRVACSGAGLWHPDGGVRRR